MASEDTKDLNRLWQEQPAEEVRMKLEDTRARALKLKNRGDRRNLRESAAAVVVLVACIALGLREFYVTICLILCVFVTLTILLEFYRGAHVIAARSGSNILFSAERLRCAIRGATAAISSTSVSY